MKVLLFGGAATSAAVSRASWSPRPRRHRVHPAGKPEGEAPDGVTSGPATSPARITVAELAEGTTRRVGGRPKARRTTTEEILVGATRALIEGLRKTDVRRLVVVGGGGSLEVAPGVRLIDTPNFPEMWRANALAQIESLALYREVDDLDWTFISPAALIEPGERTGTFPGRWRPTAARRRGQEPDQHRGLRGRVRRRAGEGRRRRATDHRRVLTGSCEGDLVMSTQNPVAATESRASRLRFIIILARSPRSGRCPTTPTCPACPISPGTCTPRRRRRNCR